MSRKRPLVDSLNEYLETAPPAALIVVRDLVNGAVKRRLTGTPIGATAPGATRRSKVNGSVQPPVDGAQPLLEG